MDSAEAQLPNCNEETYLVSYGFTSTETTQYISSRAKLEFFLQEKALGIMFQLSEAIYPTQKKKNHLFFCNFKATECILPGAVLSPTFERFVKLHLFSQAFKNLFI